MIVYLIHISLFLNFIYIKAEPALPSYDLNAGEWPEGTPNTDKTVANLMDRWFIDKKDAKCKPFEYRGTKGNFNNFPSQKLCERHLNAELTQAEKLQGCKIQTTNNNEHLGACTENKNDQTTKYYFNQSEGTCTQFNYNKCGGTFNRYDSEDEYKKNGGLSNDKYNAKVTGNDLTKFGLPNYLDCHLTPDVKKPNPDTKVIALVKEQKCVYSSVDTELERGYFENLRDCVKKCFHSNDPTNKPLYQRKIEACDKENPDQLAMTNSDSDDSVVMYYYKNSEKKCKRFETGPDTSSSVVFDKTRNRFFTLDLCHSYCGTEDYNENIAPEKTCKMEKAGVVLSSSSSSPIYKVKRYYYKEENSGQMKKCKTFYYSGIDGNTNNFKTLNECKKVCGDNMRPGETIIDDTDDTSTTPSQ